jgi:hypothetical protein
MRAVLMYFYIGPTGLGKRFLRTVPEEMTSFDAPHHNKGARSAEPPTTRHGGYNSTAAEGMSY